MQYREKYTGETREAREIEDVRVEKETTEQRNGNQKTEQEKIKKQERKKI